MKKLYLSDMMEILYIDIEFQSLCLGTTLDQREINLKLITSVLSLGSLHSSIEKGKAGGFML